MLHLVLISKHIFLFPEILKNGFEKYLLVNLRISNEVILSIFECKSISEKDLNSKIDEVSSLDIFKLTNKYLSKPFLSISGSKKICSLISTSWEENF